MQTTTTTGSAMAVAEVVDCVRSRAQVRQIITTPDFSGGPFFVAPAAGLDDFRAAGGGGGARERPFNEPSPVHSSVDERAMKRRGASYDRNTD